MFTDSNQNKTTARSVKQTLYIEDEEGKVDGDNISSWGPTLVNADI